MTGERKRESFNAACVTPRMSYKNAYNVQFHIQVNVNHIQVNVKSYRG